MVSLCLEPVLHPTQHVTPAVFFTFGLFVCLVVSEMGSHACIPSWPGTCYVDQHSLELKAIHLPQLSNAGIAGRHKP